MRTIKRVNDLTTPIKKMYNGQYVIYKVADHFEIELHEEYFGRGKTLHDAEWEIDNYEYEQKKAESRYCELFDC